MTFHNRPRIYSFENNLTTLNLYFFCVLINRNKKSKQNGSLVWSFSGLSLKQINISSYFSFEIDEPIYIHILKEKISNCRRDDYEYIYFS
jgi:hypothetical protein